VDDDSNLGLHTGIISNLHGHDKCVQYLFGNHNWRIFNRQEKTSVKQDYTLNRIEHLEKYNEKLLEKILDLNRKIDSLLEDKV
jgi:hypothetical protein